MKKVCIDVRMAFHAGIGTYIRNVIEGIKNAPFHFQLLAPTAFLQNWPVLAEFEVIPLQAPIYSIQEQLMLPLKIPSCDLFWSPHWNIPLAPIRARRRLVTIHDVYHLAHARKFSLWKRWYAKTVVTAATRLSHHLVTISQFSQSEVVKWTKSSPSEISVIPLGVDRQLFTPCKDALHLKTMRERYHLPSNFMLFVSTLLPHKNVSRLLKAWVQVVKKHPDCHLVLVGKKHPTSDHEQVMGEFPSLLSSVHHLGAVEGAHLPAIYQLALGAITPSLYEGFGLPPLEAMSVGCPTIVSSVASLPEVCGEASLYINPLDEQDMAQKICQLIENPSLRHALIEKGHARAAGFTWKQVVGKHLELFEKFT